MKKGLLIVVSGPAGSGKGTVNGELIKKEGFALIPSRREAIAFASKSMGKNGVLLLLGKGHEEYEITADGKAYFNEREILDEVFFGDY